MASNNPACVSLDKPLDLSEPRSPHLREENNSYIAGLMWKLDEIECLAWCLVIATAQKKKNTCYHQLQKLDSVKFLRSVVQTALWPLGLLFLLDVTSLEGSQVIPVHPLNNRFQASVLHQGRFWVLEIQERMKSLPSGRDKSMSK